MCVMYKFVLIGGCGMHHVNIDIGQSQHYRYEGWDGSRMNNGSGMTAVRDDRVWTHRDTVISNSNRVFKAIDFE